MLRRIFWTTAALALFLNCQSGCTRPTREQLLIEIQTRVKRMVKEEFQTKMTLSHEVAGAYQRTYDVAVKEGEKTQFRRREGKGLPMSERFDRYIYDETKDIVFTEASDPWKPVKAKVHYIHELWLFDSYDNIYRPDTIYEIDEQWSYYKGECAVEKVLETKVRRVWKRELEKTNPSFEKKIKELDYGKIPEKTKEEKPAEEAKEDAQK